MKIKFILLLILTLCFTYSVAYSQEINNDENIFDSLSETVNPYSHLTGFDKFVPQSGEIVFKQNSRRFDSLDPCVSATFFPGGRGANKLVIYTSNFGLHTGTNEFGTEAIVVGNTVTSLSGADSTIPQNGFVISGHGVAKNWITQNVTIGSKVYVDPQNNIITVYTTSDSYTFEAKSKISEAQSMIDYHKTIYQNYDDSLPSGHIKIAQNYLTIAESQKQNSTFLRQYTQEAIDSANLAIKTSLPYVKNELKGTWIRPVETSKEQIISTLEKLEANGFNNIFLETYFHGKTIFPSRIMNKFGYTIQNELFTGFDPLEVWIKEAHKRNIKVHIWFQSFYVGNKAPELNPTSILALRPDWGNKTKKYADLSGATMSVSEHNGYFLDPANPEVQDFLLQLLEEIICEYKPDGINLDYIRYPNANASNDMAAWGFTEYARNDFKEQYGVDPIELTIADPLWLDWNQYRRYAITKFVEKVGELCRKEDTYFSTVIFPDLASALSTKQQDWRSWSANNYIDGFTPLFLTYDSGMLASMMDDVMRVKAPKTELYAGLFVTFMGGSAEDLVRQIYQTRRMNANGVILFDYAHTTPVYTSTLMAGAFNEAKPVKTVVAQKQKKKWFQKKKKSKKET